MFAFLEDHFPRLHAKLYGELDRQIWISTEATREFSMALRIELSKEPNAVPVQLQTATSITLDGEEELTLQDHQLAIISEYTGGWISSGRFTISILTFTPIETE